MCPADCIVIDGPATDLADRSPRINVAEAPCVMCDGLVCSTSCPTGALAPVTPRYSPAGWLEVPYITNVGWAIISLSMFAGAFNVEIFRAGVEAVPTSTQEAASALGYTRLQIYRYIVLPLALRVSLPALNNNLVNLVKTTTQAFVIAVPELLYQSITIWNDHPSAQNPMMLVLFVSYLALVGVLVLGMNKWERAMRIPGYGG